MKTTLLITAAGLIFSTQALLATVAKPSRDLAEPALIIDALTEGFPDFLERRGGYSLEFNIEEVACSRYVELGTSEKQFRLASVCIARTDNLARKVEGQRAEALFDALYNGGAEKRSKTGVTHFVAEDLSCVVIEPKPRDPMNVVKAEYSCTISN